MLLKFNRLIFRVVRSIPVVRDFLFIINAYAWAGDPRFVFQFASVGNYYKRIISKMFFCLMLTLATMLAGQADQIDLLKIDIPGINLGLFPNLLGFGIGVYALIFIFPKDLLSRLNNSQKQGSRRVGAQGLNTAIAYPLAVFLLILIVSFYTRFIKPTEMVWGLCIFLAFYGLVMCLELVTFMLMAARRLIANYVDPQFNEPDDRL